jgi:hypothetical protein
MAAMKRSLLLWSIALGSPVIWFISFSISYAVAGAACAMHWKPALYVISLVALLMTAGCGMAAWTQWQRLGREYPGDSAGATPASRALVSGGVLLSALFSLVILAQILAQAILEPCQ